MNALVTGAGGFIGSNLVNKLLELNYNVQGIDNNPRITNPKVIITPIDVINIKKFRYKPDVIFHLAAQSRVQPSFDNPKSSFIDNVAGTLAILEYAREYKCKVVYAGSSSKHHNPYDSPYATTKMMGEELCKMYRECFDVNVEIARFYNVYGPNEALDPINGNVIGIWRWCIENGSECHIVGDGEQRRDFIHVEDIVDGLITIADSVSHHQDAWELGTGTNYSINELADMFSNRFDVVFAYIENQKGNYRATLNTNTDAYDKLGWSPKHKLKDYINTL